MHELKLCCIDVHEGSAVPNLHVNKEQYAMMVDFDDATLEDINDIITEDQSPHVVNMLQVGN